MVLFAGMRPMVGAYSDDFLGLLNNYIQIDVICANIYLLRCKYQSYGKIRDIYIGTDVLYMSQLIELITHWEAFTHESKDKSVEEFCQYYLAQRKVRGPEIEQERLYKAGRLLVVMGRIMNSFTMYHRAAMAKTNLPSPDSFNYLSGLSTLGEVRKTELINYLFAEYTTGMEAISRLTSDGCIAERPDQNDKRAKLISLTTKGKTMLRESHIYSARVSEMIFDQVTDDTIALCLTLLKPIDERHTQMLARIRNKDFDDMYNQAVNTGPL